MAEISEAIIGALQTAMAEITAAVSSLASSISTIIANKADKVELDAKAPIASPEFIGGMTIGGLPTAADGLTAGALWVDIKNGNVIKVVL